MIDNAQGRCPLSRSLSLARLPQTLDSGLVAAGLVRMIDSGTPRVDGILLRARAVGVPDRDLSNAGTREKV